MDGLHDTINSMRAQREKIQLSGSQRLMRKTLMEIKASGKSPHRKELTQMLRPRQNLQKPWLDACGCVCGRVYMCEWARGHKHAEIAEKKHFFTHCSRMCDISSFKNTHK